MSNLIRLSFLVFVGFCLLSDLSWAQTTTKSNKKLITKPKVTVKTTVNPKLAKTTVKLETTKPPVDNLVVKTKSGSVKGKVINFEYNPTNDNKAKQKQKINAWLGIPYAEKPLGDLRFKHAEAKKKWNGTLDATTLPNSCYQLEDSSMPKLKSLEMLKPTTNLSEDCLYLNIYTPSPKPKNANVIVIIFLSLCFLN